MRHSQQEAQQTQQMQGEQEQPLPQEEQQPQQDQQRQQQEEDLLVVGVVRPVQHRLLLTQQQARQNEGQSQEQQQLPRLLQIQQLPCQNEQQQQQQQQQQLSHDQRNPGQRNIANEMQNRQRAEAMQRLLRDNEQQRQHEVLLLQQQQQQQPQQRQQQQQHQHFNVPQQPHLFQQQQQQQIEERQLFYRQQQQQRMLEQQQQQPWRQMQPQPGFVAGNHYQYVQQQLPQFNPHLSSIHQRLLGRLPSRNPAPHQKTPLLPTPNIVQDWSQFINNQHSAAQGRAQSTASQSNRLPNEYYARDSQRSAPTRSYGQSQHYAAPFYPPNTVRGSSVSFQQYPQYVNGDVVTRRLEQEQARSRRTKRCGPDIPPTEHRPHIVHLRSDSDNVDAGTSEQPKNKRRRKDDTVSSSAHQLPAQSFPQPGRAVPEPNPEVNQLPLFVPTTNEQSATASSAAVGSYGATDEQESDESLRQMENRFQASLSQTLINWLVVKSIRNQRDPENARLTLPEYCALSLALAPEARFLAACGAQMMSPMLCAPPYSVPPMTAAALFRQFRETLAAKEADQPPPLIPISSHSASGDGVRQETDSLIGWRPRCGSPVVGPSSAFDIPEDSMCFDLTAAVRGESNAVSGASPPYSDSLAIVSTAQAAALALADGTYQQQMDIPPLVSMQDNFGTSASDTSDSDTSDCESAKSFDNSPFSTFGYPFSNPNNSKPPHLDTGTSSPNQFSSNDNSSSSTSTSNNLNLLSVFPDFIPIPSTSNGKVNYTTVMSSDFNPPRSYPEYKNSDLCTGANLNSSSSFPSPDSSDPNCNPIPSTSNCNIVHSSCPATTRPYSNPSRNSELYIAANLSSNPSFPSPDPFSVPNCNSSTNSSNYNLHSTSSTTTRSYANYNPTPCTTVNNSNTSFPSPDSSVPNCNPIPNISCRLVHSSSPATIRPYSNPSRNPELCIEANLNSNPSLPPPDPFSVPNSNSSTNNCNYNLHHCTSSTTTRSYPNRNPTPCTTAHNSSTSFPSPDSSVPNCNPISNRNQHTTSSTTTGSYPNHKQNSNTTASHTSNASVPISYPFSVPNFNPNPSTSDSNVRDHHSATCDRNPTQSFPNPNINLHPAGNPNFSTSSSDPFFVPNFSSSSSTSARNHSGFPSACGPNPTRPCPAPFRAPPAYPVLNPNSDAVNIRLLISDFISELRTKKPSDRVFPSHFPAESYRFMFRQYLRYAYCPTLHIKLFYFHDLTVFSIRRRARPCRVADGVVDLGGVTLSLFQSIRPCDSEHRDSLLDLSRRDAARHSIGLRENAGGSVQEGDGDDNLVGDRHFEDGNTDTLEDLGGHAVSPQSQAMRSCAFESGDAPLDLSRTGGTRHYAGPTENAGDSVEVAGEHVIDDSDDDSTSDADVDSEHSDGVDDSNDAVDTVGGVDNAGVQDINVGNGGTKKSAGRTKYLLFSGTLDTSSDASDVENADVQDLNRIDDRIAEEYPLSSETVDSSSHEGSLRIDTSPASGESRESRDHRDAPASNEVIDLGSGSDHGECSDDGDDVLIREDVEATDTDAAPGEESDADGIEFAVPMDAEPTSDEARDGDSVHSNAIDCVETSPMETEDPRGECTDSSSDDATDTDAETVASWADDLVTPMHTVDVGDSFCAVAPMDTADTIDTDGETVTSFADGLVAGVPVQTTEVCDYVGAVAPMHSVEVGAFTPAQIADVGDAVDAVTPMHTADVGDALGAVAPMYTADVGDAGNAVILMDVDVPSDFNDPNEGVSVDGERPDESYRACVPVDSRVDQPDESCGALIPVGSRDDQPDESCRALVPVGSRDDQPDQSCRALVPVGSRDDQPDESCRALVPVGRRELVSARPTRGIQPRRSRQLVFYDPATLRRNPPRRARYWLFCDAVLPTESPPPATSAASSGAVVLRRPERQRRRRDPRVLSVAARIAADGARPFTRALLAAIHRQIQESLREARAAPLPWILRPRQPR